MVNLLFVEDDDVLPKPGAVRSIYDPTAGTGGVLLQQMDKQWPTSVRSTGSATSAIASTALMRNKAVGL